MTEKNKAELQIAWNVLAIWEETYVQLPQELRQAFLNRPQLTRLVNVSDDVLRHAISKYSEIVDIVPYALAVQLETFRRELAWHRNTNQETDLAVAIEEIRKLKQELSRLRDTEEVIEGLQKNLEKLKFEHTGHAPDPNATQPARPAREQHFERLSYQQQKKIASLEINLAKYKTRVEAVREENDQLKKEREEFKAERDQLETRLKQQIGKPATEQHSKSSKPDGPIAKEESRNEKPFVTRSPRQQPKPKEKPSSQAGVAHKASGFSGKPRQMAPEFDDTEPCSQCGARISASAAAQHDCS